MYRQNLEIWGALYLRFTNVRLDQFKSGLKIKKVHQLAITSLAGLYGLYCMLESPRRVKEVLDMMLFIVEKSKDSSLSHYVALYEIHYDQKLLMFEREREEIEQVMLRFAKKFYKQETLINMYEENREPCLPGELPDLKCAMITETLISQAHTSRKLKQSLKERQCELSFDEPNPLEKKKEAQREALRVQKDQEIASIVDKEINEYFNPRPFNPKQMLQFLAKAVGSIPLFGFQSGIKTTADSVNSSAEYCHSLNLTGGLGSTIHSQRLDYERVGSARDFNLSEGRAKLSPINSPSKPHHHSFSATKRSTRVTAKPIKWNTPLAGHRSLCESVRKYTITEMQKRLGEAVLDSLNNTIETCRPLSEYRISKLECKSTARSLKSTM